MHALSVLQERVVGLKAFRAAVASIQFPTARRARKRRRGRERRHRKRVARPRARIKPAAPSVHVEGCKVATPASAEGQSRQVYSGSVATSVVLSHDGDEALTPVLGTSRMFSRVARPVPVLKLPALSTVSHGRGSASLGHRSLPARPRSLASVRRRSATRMSRARSLGLLSPKPAAAAAGSSALRPPRPPRPPSLCDVITGRLLPEVAAPMHPKRIPLRRPPSAAVAASAPPLF